MADLSWTLVREDATAATFTRPDTLCPYPWGKYTALMDPTAGLPIELYNIGEIRELRLTTLPSTGTVTYTLTRNSGLGANQPATSTIRTDDDRGLEILGDRYLTISRPGPSGSRFVILMIRDDLFRSIVRS